LGAAVAGHWSGAHAVDWDLNAPPFGDLDVDDRFQKHNYPFGIVVNARGERFLDEGLDFHSYTYAKYGGEILNQPGMFAWQVFDQKVTHLLREEYRIPRITKEKADMFEALAERLEGVDPRRFLETVRAFNAAPRPDVPFNPNIRDGLATSGLAIDKTNWAQCLDTPPYEAYAVTTGITFTFGGLKITNNAEVEDTSGHPIPGLYAAGEIAGGLFFHNYASGTGLMSGAVFGRIAGRNAAIWASTLCLFSSSTWNIAFGRVSRTVAVTSIASSFDMTLLFVYFPNTIGPSAVTATECSKWAASIPSMVRAVQPSLSVRTSWIIPLPPARSMRDFSFAPISQSIGSMAKTIPSRNSIPRPRLP